MNFRLLRGLAVCVAASLICGCSGGGGALPVMGAQKVAPAPADPTAFLRATGTQIIGMSVALTAYQSPTYGKVHAYEKGIKGTTSQIVHLTLGSSVAFENLDTRHKHTAALLGVASRTGAPWPPAFNGGTVTSPAGTDIATPGWNTGVVNTGGAMSLVYSASTAGYFMIGCLYHYKNDMRTVVVVQ